MYGDLDTSISKLQDSKCLLGSEKCLMEWPPPPRGPGWMRPVVGELPLGSGTGSKACIFSGQSFPAGN